MMRVLMWVNLIFYVLAIFRLMSGDTSILNIIAIFLNGYAAYSASKQVYKNE